MATELALRGVDLWKIQQQGGWSGIFGEHDKMMHNAWDELCSFFGSIFWANFFLLRKRP